RCRCGQRRSRQRLQSKVSGERHLGCASPKSTSFLLDGLQAVQAGPARVQVAPTLAGQAAQRARLVRVRSMLAQEIGRASCRERGESVVGEGGVTKMRE